MLPITMLHSLCYSWMCGYVQAHVGTPGPQMRVLFGETSEHLGDGASVADGTLEASL